MKDKYILYIALAVIAIAGLYYIHESLETCGVEEGFKEGVSGECTDIPPDNRYSCELQAAWGKCGEPWMQNNCNFSCGRCKDISGKPITRNPGNKVDIGTSASSSKRIANGNCSMAYNNFKKQTDQSDCICRDAFGPNKNIERPCGPSDLKAGSSPPEYVTPCGLLSMTDALQLTKKNANGVDEPYIQCSCKDRSKTFVYNPSNNRCL